MPQVSDAERQRIEQSRNGQKNWRQWGPYLSERQWGTVREDYSPGGTAWDYLSHDQARSRAYRRGRTAWPGFPTTGSFSAYRVRGRLLRSSGEAG